MLNKAIVMILITTVFIKESTQCYEGEVRLTGSRIQSQGRVEICIDSNWGTVCKDGWGRNDAAVVCYQLGYGRDGVLAFWVRRSDTDVIKVSCDSSEERLLNCPKIRSTDKKYNCIFGGGAGVRCRDEQLQIRNVSTTTVTVTTDAPYYAVQTILVSWELHSGAPHSPSSFRVQCFSQQHHSMELYVNNGTLTQINVGDLLSLSTSYACCVSVIYYQSYETESRCTSTEILPLDLFTPAPMEVINQSPTIPTSTPNSSMTPASIGLISGDLYNMRANINIIGGVLGSIIVILLLLLAICGGTLVYLSQSRSVIPKRQRSSNPVDNNSAGIPNNARYVTCSTIGSQATQSGGTDAAAEYSRIGPSYEMIDSRRQQPVAERNVALARLSERYEFSEAHLVAAAGGGRGQGEMVVDYEVLLNTCQQDLEHEEYSRLRH